ncbi:hypothetical protein Hypma_002831 [Hypsizygus marmoreus]|uniref:Uncharacterized protein n=1 Tax=Hypsizygus marmoreus TaxID=39966 RepID=A0A369J346_HYPMA|nr:hypothetical protein Hypma_002831 [Hypsizygus marmoreus]
MSDMLDSPHPAKIVFPAPPPTRNSLTAQQRMQLMRSTKKLGRILGTTPHLIDTTHADAMGEFHPPDVSESDENLTPSAAPLHIRLPLTAQDKRQSAKSYQRASMDSISSKSSMTSISSGSASLESAAPSSPTLSRSGSLRSSRSSISSSKSSNSSSSADSWSINRKNRPPMLRLAVASPLETIPASPLTTDPPVYGHRRSCSVDGFPVPPPARYRNTLQPSITPSPSPSPSPPRSHSLSPIPSSPQTSPSSPTFNIPSVSSERRMKMERLRRKLGEEVPLEMVFPPAEDSDSDDLGTLITPLVSSPTTESSVTTPGSSPISSVSSEHQENHLLPPPAVTPAPRRPRPTNRIANSRDSISLESPHHARRTFIAPKASRPAPPPPVKAKEGKKMVKKDTGKKDVGKKEVTHIKHDRFSYVVVSADRHSLEVQEQEQEQEQSEVAWEMEKEREKETGRLGVILECPDEDFGLGAGVERRGSGNQSRASLGVDSGWYASEEEEDREAEELDEDVRWKRRSGYGAWAWAGLEGERSPRSPASRRD